MSISETTIVVCIAIAFAFVWTMFIRASARGSG
jgi:hypothetical protein